MLVRPVGSWRLDSRYMAFHIIPSPRFQPSRDLTQIIHARLLLGRKLRTLLSSPSCHEESIRVVFMWQQFATVGRGCFVIAKRPRINRKVPWFPIAATTFQIGIFPRTHHTLIFQIHNGAGGIDEPSVRLYKTTCLLENVQLKGGKDGLEVVLGKSPTLLGPSSQSTRRCTRCIHQYDICHVVG